MLNRHKHNIQLYQSFMKLGISDLSIIPVRKEPSEKSEMTTQILFGEQFEINEETEKWVYIKLKCDGYEGWIDRKMVTELNTDSAINEIVCTTETLNIVSRIDTWGNKMLVPGSNLPFFNKENKHFKVGDVEYILNGDIANLEANKTQRDALIDYAMKYYNSPYLWGGKTPYGIDCSGLTQMAYKLMGISIPRDASQQVNIGDTLLFVDEAKPGDLAFFGDEEGKVTHVGIIWKHHKIIHASGRVRIDNVDQEGIYNEELRRYTHKLRTIKRIIK